ncbi:MAG: hypothetical protein ABJF23_11225 [Bryobacteraceae bacterium]
MSRSTAMAAVFVACVAAAIVAVAWPVKGMSSRDIGCSQVSGARGRQICQALSDSMEWTWMGHAIIAPGFRVTWDALRRVYCHAKVNAADIPLLEAMKQGSDWRLQDGADLLIRLIRSREGTAVEPESSIFNPANPQYPLKNGCAGD